MELLDADAEFSTQKYKNFKNVLDSEIQMISWLDFSNSKLVRDAYFPGCMCVFVNAVHLFSFAMYLFWNYCGVSCGVIQWCIIIFAHFKLSVLPTKNGGITVFAKPDNIVKPDNILKVIS